MPDEPQQPSEAPKLETYVGDGVYAVVDSYGVHLDTRAQLYIQRIALEPDVLATLLDWLARRAPELLTLARERSSALRSVMAEN